MRTAFSIVYIVIFVKFTKWIKKLRLKSYMLYLKSVRILKSSLLANIQSKKRVDFFLNTLAPKLIQLINSPLFF